MLWNSNTHAASSSAAILWIPCEAYEQHDRSYVEIILDHLWMAFSLETFTVFVYRKGRRRVYLITTSFQINHKWWTLHGMYPPCSISEQMKRKSNSYVCPALRAIAGVLDILVAIKSSLSKTEWSFPFHLDTEPLTHFVLCQVLSLGRSYPLEPGLY